MLCAVYSSPQETSKHSILWSDNGKTKLEKRSINAMATKKGGKKVAAKKGGAKKAAAKKGGAKKAAKKR